MATTMDTYSHVIPMLQQDCADKMDEILKPVAVKEGDGMSAAEANELKRIGRGEWIRTTGLLVPNCQSDLGQNGIEWP
jgi:hypothetical protein